MELGKVEQLPSIQQWTTSEHIVIEYQKSSLRTHVLSLLKLVVVINFHVLLRKIRSNTKEMGTRELNNENEIYRDSNKKL